MRKLYLLLALLLTFSSSAWADFDQPWTNTPSPWSNQAATGVPQAVTSVKTESDGTVYSSTVQAVRLNGDNRSITVGFTFTSGNYALTILGVELLNSNQEVINASSVYERKQAGSNKVGAIYTLSTDGVTAGTYYLRYYVCVGSNENITGTNGIITVRGLNAAGGTGLTNYKSITSLNDLSNNKLYLLKSGRSFGSTSNHYLLWNGSVAPNNLSCTYLAANSMEFSATTTNFQFAIYKSGNAYYLYNMAAGKFVGNNDNNNGAIPMVKMPTNQVYFKASENGTYNWMLSTNNFIGALNAADNSNGILNWNGGNNNKTDLGNCFNIIEVDGANVTADLQTTLETYIGWGPAYNEVKWDVEAASDTRVTAITSTSATTINEKLTAFETNPTTDNYDAMVNAHAAADRVTLSAGEKFTIKCVESNRGYMVYSTVENKGSEEIVNLAGTSNNTLPGLNENGVYKEWVFVEIDGKKYIYNVQNQKFIKKGTPVKFDEVGTFVEIANIGNTLFNIKFEGTNQYLSFSQGWGLNSCVRTGGSVDNGCKFYLDKTGETDSNFSSIEANLYKVNLNEKLAKGRLLGSGLGKYTYNGGEDAETTIANAERVLASPASTKDDILSAISALEALYANFSINQPVAGKLYRFKGHASNHYICPTNTETGNQKFMAMNANSDHAATVFMLVEGSEGKFKLLNYGFGYYTTQTYCCGANKANANNIQFSESTTYPGYYTMKSDASEVGTWLYDQSSKVNRNGNYVANNCDWKIEEVTWLPIPINTAYQFGTIVPPADLALESAGTYSADGRLKFYTATIGTDGYVELKKVTQNIKAGEPYVVELVTENGMSQGSQFMQITSGAPDLQPGNALRGSYETVAKPEGTIYTLQAAWDETTDNHLSTSKVAFRQYDGTTIKGFRAYLPVANNVRIAGMRIVDGDVTRIEGVNAEESHKVDVYDLSGRRVQRATKGLYIINGKKVIVK